MKKSKKVLSILLIVFSVFVGFLVIWGLVANYCQTTSFGFMGAPDNPITGSNSITECGFNIWFDNIDVYILFPILIFTLSFSIGIYLYRKARTKK